MALNTTTVGGTPVPGLLSSVPSVQASPGVQAVSPSSNLKAPTNTLPSTQIAPKDLSATYGRTADGTIYNKQSQAKFSNPADFFKDSGVTSFDNLKFDTGYTPSGKESIYGQPQVNPQSQPPTPIAPAQQPVPQQQPAPVPNTPYTPPNQGTTGVSQGGIIGNLLGIANKESPEVTNARAQLSGLQQDYGQQNADILSRPEGLTQQTGQQGILQQLFATKQGALQTALSSALTSQGQQISANQAAGGLNAPITGVPYGTQTISPSQPAANTPFGTATTSGAANLSSLIGQRSVPGQAQQEFYNTQTGQGFATPQALADFVNQQMPGVNATAANVFDVLKQQQAGGGANGLNPVSQIPTLAAQVIANPSSYAQALATGGNVANFASALQAEIRKTNPNFDFNAATAQGEAQKSIINTQTQQAADWKQAQQQAQAFTGQLQPLLSKINPSNLTFANGVIQGIASNFGDPTYQQASNLLTELANTYARILTPNNGTVTDTVRSTATGMINALASGQSIAQVINALDAQAQAKISATQTGTNLQGLTGNAGSIPPGALTIN